MTEINPRRNNMRANRRRDSKPELALRSLLFASGFRYRCDLRLDFGSDRVRPDIVFTKRKVAVFVDGCFWHSCPLHGGSPRANIGYWGPKLARNRERDAENNAVLKKAGWLVVRVWEHELPDEALGRVVSVLEATERSSSRDFYKS